MKNVEVGNVCSVYLLKLRPSSLTASLTELDLSYVNLRERRAQI